MKSKWLKQMGSLLRVSSWMKELCIWNFFLARALSIFLALFLCFFSIKFGIFNLHFSLYKWFRKKMQKKNNFFLLLFKLVGQIEETQGLENGLNDLHTWKYILHERDRQTYKNLPKAHPTYRRLITKLLSTSVVLKH